MCVRGTKVSRNVRESDRNSCESLESTDGEEII